MKKKNVAIPHHPTDDQVNHALGTLVQVTKNLDQDNLWFGFDITTTLGHSEKWEIEVRRVGSLVNPENN